MLYMLRKTAGYSSRGALTKSKKCAELLGVTKFLVTPGGPILAHIRHNMELFVFSEPAPEDPTTMVMFMVDDVAVEPALRHDSYQHCLLGHCREHHHEGLQYREPATVQQVEDYVNQIKTGSDTEKGPHLAKTLTVFGMTFHKRGGRHHFRPILAFPSCCKDNTARFIAPCMQEIEEVWQAEQRGAKTHGPAAGWSSDGAAQFMLAMGLRDLPQLLHGPSPLTTVCLLYVCVVYVCM